MSRGRTKPLEPLKPAQAAAADPEAHAWVAASAGTGKTQVLSARVLRLLLAGARPDAIFNGTFGPDLTNFVRQGNTRGLFEKRGVVSVLTGEPEYLEPLGDETPEGWIVTGWPVESVTDASNAGFIAAYRAKFGEAP